MVNAELLAILCCPETHQPLTLANLDVVAEVNARIALGGLVNRGGGVVREPIEGGLIRQDGKFLYVIRQEIPNLLIDEAIALPLSEISFSAPSK